MFSSREAFENDFCPVRDELLGEMYRADGNGLIAIGGERFIRCARDAGAVLLSQEPPAPLALSIATSCCERELIHFGGRVGSTLYALSREPAARAVPSSSYGSRKPITLSTKPLKTFAPVDDEVEDDLAEAVPA